MTSSLPSTTPDRSLEDTVVVLGAGFGGLAATTRLAELGVPVTLIDQRNHHTFQPLLYQVATAGLDVDDICYTTRAIVSRHDHACTRQARVTDIDLDTRIIRTDTGDIHGWRALVVALGATTADFGVPGVATHAYGLKSAAEATAIRDHVLDAFEAASRMPSADRPDALTSIVIVGGGPTGVEMAGGFAELFERVLAVDFPELDRPAMTVTLIEAGPRLLSHLDERLSRNALVKLQKMGVEVLLDTAVAGVDADAVRLADGTVRPAGTTVWAAGVKANPLAERLGVQTGRGGRVIVDAELRLPAHPDVFVIGDIAATPDLDAGHTDEQPVHAPQVAPVAMQAGRYVADLIHGEGDATSPEPFAYRDKGSMATIGRNSAVVELPNGLRFGGFVGWLSWLGLHLVMLIGFRNRANVLVNWAWNYLTWDRGSRVVVDADEAELMLGTNDTAELMLGSEGTAGLTEPGSRAALPNADAGRP